VLLSPAALVALVGTIIIQFYFHIRFRQFSLVRQAELLVSDVQSAVYPHLFIISLNGEEIKGSPFLLE
jgi:hypothetical protein